MTDYVSVLGGPALAALGAGAQKLWSKYRAPRPFRRLVGMNPDAGATIVMPYRARIETEDEGPDAADALIHANVHVTFHDMLAVNYAERVLTLANFADKSIQVQTVSDDRDAGVAQTEQLVLVCSPRANALSAAANDYLTKRYADYAVGFELVSIKPERWRINFKGAFYESHTYSEIPTLRAEGKDPNLGPLNDYALLGRFPNPWAPKKSKVLLIAGIRGIGTWGAARFLRDNAPRLDRQFRGRDFLCVVRVRFQQYKIAHSEMVNDAVLE